MARHFNCRCIGALMSDVLKGWPAGVRKSGNLKLGMKAFLRNIILVILVVVSWSAPAVTRYANQGNPTPAPPFDSWLTAATNIQDAIDAAVDGDLILVTNGFYATGGQEVYPGLTNRVAITKPVRVQSVNGPLVTTIWGFQVPGVTNASSAVRCVYATNGVILSGFTLANGATLSSGDETRVQSGGGVWCESSSVILSNCVLVGNSSASIGGGVFSGTLWSSSFSNNTSLFSGGGASHARLFDCLVVANFANSGGGAFRSQLTGCVVRSNSAYMAGGVYLGTITNSVIQGNQADSGGGVSDAVIESSQIIENVARNGFAGGGSGLFIKCVLSGNQSPLGMGGGTVGGSLIDCVITNNSAGAEGGGCWRSYLDQCLVVSNRAWVGGGTVEGVVRNCVLIGNSAGWLGGGAVNPQLVNSIVYYNSAAEDNNCAGGFAMFSCTIPLPEFAPGSFTNEPNFINLASGNYLLSSNSPCINSGANKFVTNSVDLAGNFRIVAGNVDVGVFEYQTPTSAMSYAWAQQYGFSTDGSADWVDADQDGVSNYGEWRCDTNPTNVLSVLRLENIWAVPSGINVTWQGVTTRDYWLERATNLSHPSFERLITYFIPGMPGTNSFTDTTATNVGPYFYRLGVQ